MRDNTYTFHDIVWTILPWILQTLVWIPTRIILRFFFHIYVDGVEHVKDLHGPVIFAVNHTSFWDPILVTGALPFFSRRFPMMYVAREKAYYHRYGKFFPMFLFKACGVHPAQGGIRDYATSFITHERLLKKGRSLCMFPEGKVFRATEKIQPLKGGIGYLACVTKSIVVHVVIYGMAEFRVQDFFKQSCSVQVLFGNPIPYDISMCPQHGIDVSHCVDAYKAYAEIIRTHMEMIVSSVENESSPERHNLVY